MQDVIVFRHACLYNDLNVPFCMLFSDSSKLFLRVFIVLIREIIKNKTGVAVDQPDSTGAWGTTTTRNSSKVSI